MPLTPGQILNNRYRIVSLLGQGGFGAVYRAWDLNLSRPCAVKENLDTSPEAQKQFGREAVLLANLSHPNLVRVSDYFFLPGQGQYFVMDFVEGKDLDQMLQGGQPLPVEQVLRWAGQICAALEYLHAQKQPVIHRDLKPANIKIDPEGNAILVDFGIAKIYDPQLRTTQGARAVTPGYSPPEQYGQGHTDTRTDIYALGATLYTALTGIVPHDSVDIITGNAPAPAPAHVANPQVPFKVSQALVKAMNVQRTERFASMTELRLALATAAAAVPAASPKPASSKPAPAKAQPVQPPASSAYPAYTASAQPVAPALVPPGSRSAGALSRKWPWVIGAVGGMIGLCLLGWVIYQNVQPEPTPVEGVAKPEDPVFTEIPQTIETLEITEIPEWLLPTATLPFPTEPCGPLTFGSLAGVDPRGQTVIWWHNHAGTRQEGLNVIVAEFNATNPCGIIVEGQNQGGYDDIRDKMNAGISTGDLPGLVVGYQNDQEFYALAGGLIDINIYLNNPYWGLTAEEQADFYPAFLEQSVHPAFENMRLGFPPNRSIEIMYYNQTWLEELGFAGPPTTPEEFRIMSCVAAAANGDGTGGYILRDDASAIAAWTYAFGGNVLTVDGLGYVYNGQATIDAMTFLKGMYDTGCAHFYEDYPNTEFAARRAIFTTGSSSGMRNYAEDIATVSTEAGREPDVWGIAAYPHTTPDPVIIIYGGDVMIPATNPEIQLASWIFIKWYTSPEIQARWAEISGYFQTRASTSEFLGDYIANNTAYGAQYQQAMGLLQFGAFEPQLITYQTIRENATDAFNAIMQGADIQATLDELTLEANALQAELMAP